MVLENIVNLHSDEEPWEPARVRGCVHTKVSFTVHAVSNVKVHRQSPKSNMWYTITPQESGSSKSTTMGKLTSRKIASGDGHFDTQHEMIVDTGMVHGLVLKVKTTSSILQRKVTIGTYTLKVSSASNSSVDEVVNLTDKKGDVVGNIHISFTIAPTTLPALHFAPQPFQAPLDDVLLRPYTSLALDGFGEHLVTFFQGQTGNIKVQGVDGQRFQSTQVGNDWNISEKISRSSSSQSALKMWLACTPAADNTSRPMHFALEDESSTASSLALLPGNAADPSQQEAAWGTWTLVRQFAASEETKRPDEFLALIDLAGPVVEAWAAKDVPVALAVANAMFWSCMGHAPSQLEVQRKIKSAASRKCTSSAQHGRGFFVLDEMTKDADVTELRAIMSGVGANLASEERCVSAFLRTANSTKIGKKNDSGATVDKQAVGWSAGNTLLGLALVSPFN